MKPTIALIGRPNVGKSTLFNRLTNSRKALVADHRALTRDRQYGMASINDHEFILIDTPGLVDKAKDIEKYVQQQTIAAIEEADIILFIISAKEDLVAEDYLIASILRKHNKHILLLVNKIDGVNTDLLNSDIYKFGWPIQLISALQARGVNQVLTDVLTKWYQENQVAQALPADDEQGKDIKITIVGRPNVGKSTLINQLIGEERLVTYDEPGTTRDSITVPYTYQDQDYLLIDTAGIRKRKMSAGYVEKFSIQKTLLSIEESSITVLIIDAADGLVAQDLNLIHLITENKHALVIAINKTDVLSIDEKKKMKDDIRHKLRFIGHINIEFICATKGYGLKKLHQSILTSYANATSKWSTHKLTTLLLEANQKHTPPAVAGKRSKMRYAHQGGSLPLTIVIHGKRMFALPQNYKTYLENYYYKQLNITGAPIKLLFKDNEAD